MSAYMARRLLRPACTFDSQPGPSLNPPHERTRTRALPGDVTLEAGSDLTNPRGSGLKTGLMTAMADPQMVLSCRVFRMFSCAAGACSACR